MEEYDIDFSEVDFSSADSQTIRRVTSADRQAECLDILTASYPHAVASERLDYRRLSDLRAQGYRVLGGADAYGHARLPCEMVGSKMRQQYQLLSLTPDTPARKALGVTSTVDSEGEVKVSIHQNHDGIYSESELDNFEKFVTYAINRWVEAHPGVTS